MSLFAPKATGSALKFTAIGDEHIVTVKRGAEKKQRIDPMSKQPLTYPSDGNPKMQIIVPVADEQGDDRKLYVDCYSRLEKALLRAVGDAGMNDLHPGTKLRIKYTHNGQGKGSIPPKEYAVEILTPGTPAAAAPAAPATEDYDYVEVVSGNSGALTVEGRVAQVDPWSADNDDF